MTKVKIYLDIQLKHKNVYFLTLYTIPIILSGKSSFLIKQIVIYLNVTSYTD